MTRNTPKIPRIQSAGTYALILTLLLSLAGVAIAADVEREQRLVAELEASLFDGDLQRLSAGKVTFTAVELRPDSTPVRGSIILLHGRGVHADWPDNIGPLRMALAQNGWHTLSLQMPVLEKSAKYFDYLAILPEAFPRIEAGIKHLLTSGHRPSFYLRTVVGHTWPWPGSKQPPEGTSTPSLVSAWVRLTIGSPCRDLSRLQHSRSRCLIFMAPKTTPRYTAWHQFAWRKYNWVATVVRPRWLSMAPTTTSQLIPVRWPNPFLDGLIH